MDIANKGSFSKKIKQGFLLLFLLFSLVPHAQTTANDGGIATSPSVRFTGTAGLPSLSLNANQTAGITYQSKGEQTKKIRNIFMLWVHEETTKLVPQNFTAEVTINIDYKLTLGSAVTSIQKKLTVEYKKNSGEKYNAKSYFLLPDAEDVTVTIASVMPSPSSIGTGATALDIKDIITLAYTQEITRYYELASNVLPTSITLNLGTVASTPPNQIPDYALLAWAWPATAGNNATQIEWTWLENELASTYTVAGNIDIDLLFRNNATRVDIPYKDDNLGYEYKIPLLYDALNNPAINGNNAGGKLYVRIRPVNIKANGNRTDGDWALASPLPFEGHEPNLNWQVTTSFAEEGKYKTVISYFDGSLRSRQTVTKDNVTGNVLSSETFYDYQGRPAVQILPTPSIDKLIKYQKDLNLFNGQVSNASDPAAFFDLESQGLTTYATSLLNTGNGSSNYYSSANLQKNNAEDRFIPDAAGYPFTVTRYTPDATGRVLAQSGVGATHKMGTDKVTKYYYGTPAQEELDGLFGTEVGKNTHYSKNMVKDANNQMSVSYVDMHGRTIATALAGDAPNNLAAVNPLVYPNPNFGPSITRNLLDANTNIVKNSSAIESITTLLVPATTSYKFTYTLNPESVQLMNCSNQPICYDCMYNLEIVITDESGETVPLKYLYNNISLNADHNCSTPTKAFVSEQFVSTPSPLPNTFIIDATLPPGSYSIRKTLTISEPSLEKMKKEYAETAACQTYESILTGIQQQIGCGSNEPTATCQSCTTALVDYKTNYFASLGYSGSNVSNIPQSIRDDVDQMYAREKAECDKLCKVSQAMPATREMMLADMYPFTGQYAMGNDFTEFHSPTLLTDYSMHHKYDVFSKTTTDPLHPFYKYPQNPKKPGAANANGNRDYYYDESNQKDLSIIVNNAYTFLDGITDEKLFSGLFKNSWANSLLPFHPEYNKLLFAEDLNKLAPSYDWINTFAMQDVWPLSGTPANLINVPGTSLAVSSAVDPFYTYSGITDPTSPAIDYYTSIFNKVNIEMIAGSNISMWQIAYGNLYCKSIADQSQRNVCYLHAPSDPSFEGSKPLPSPQSGLYSSISPAQRDQVWTVFQGLYMAERNRQLNDYLNNKVPLADAQTLADHGYKLHFPLNDQQAVAQGDEVNHGNWWPTTPGGAPNNVDLDPATNNANTYVSQCESYIATWKSRLLECPTLAARSDKDVILTAITTRMKAVCIKGSDPANPNGASNASPANTTGTDDSFEEVIKAVFEEKGIALSNLCTPYLIEWPKKYGKGPALTAGVITVLDECTCEKFSQLKEEVYAHDKSGNDYNDFNEYVLAAYGESMPEELYNSLQENCGNLGHQICTAPTTTLTWDPCKNELEPNCPNNHLKSSSKPPPGPLDSCPETKTCIGEQVCTSSNIYVLPEPLPLPRFMKCGLANNVNCLTCEEMVNLTNAFVEEGASIGLSGAFIEYPSINGTSDLSEEEIARNILLAQYMNYQTGMQFTWMEYLQAAQNLPCYLNGEKGNEETSGQAVICRSPQPLNTGNGIGTEPNPCQTYINLATAMALQVYQQDHDKKMAAFDLAYRSKCLAVKEIEKFEVAYQSKEYHYTLYYYDQAGNLVKTVPPQGAKPDFSPATLSIVAAKRNDYLLTGIYKNATVNNEKVPDHNLATQYCYNTLNQVVAQSTPDAGTSHFWYDALGRLVVSQNAQQWIDNKYSYTLYDNLGRITEVGQLPQAANSMTDIIAKSVTVPATPYIPATPSSPAIPASPAIPSALHDWLHRTGTYAYSTGTPQQITRTTYDLDYFSGTSILCPTPGSLCFFQQLNLRNRVSYTAVYNTLSEVDMALPQDHSSATLYTYDIHGNVDVLLQDYGDYTKVPNIMNANGNANKFKKISYEYDLISGKVNRVNYQPGAADQFYHRYKYDAENRLIEAQTSHDDIVWERDASYKYYKHGPLARTVLGQQQVQGLDYAYTIQGWLKGVNSTAVSAPLSETACAPGSANDLLTVTNRAQYGQPSQYLARQEIVFDNGFSSVGNDDFVAEIDATATACQPQQTAGGYIDGDMGNDGDATPLIPSGSPAINSNIARDAFGFSLNYFRGDYSPINAAYHPFAVLPNTPLPNTIDGVQTGSDLFNGNIGSMVVNIAKLGEAKLYGYRYDQLNRIVAMNSYTGFNNQGNTYGTAGPSVSEDYKERVSYDANGNILSYLRNGINQGASQHAMDQMDYGYNKDVTTGRLTNNKLRHIKDAIGSSNYTEDIDDQSDDNYTYDAIGNLIIDRAEGIYDPAQPTKPMIEWTVYGKISSVTKIKAGVTTTITYTYDASGNRISKNVHTAANGNVTTWYARDASGNVMAVYGKKASINSNHLTQTEVHLYGSSRLGVYNINRDLEQAPPISPDPVIDGVLTFARGNKLFELSNHLGNVLATVTDKKLQVDDGTYQNPCSGTPCHTNVMVSAAMDGVVDYYMADVVTANDYYPFGMAMPGRKYAAPNSDYRYGFNGKENDKDMGEGVQDYGMRIYDARIGKFLSVDPLTKDYAFYTPYQFAGNMPISCIDLDGCEPTGYSFTARGAKKGDTWISLGTEQRVFNNSVFAGKMYMMKIKDTKGESWMVFRQETIELTCFNRLETRYDYYCLIGDKQLPGKAGYQIDGKIIGSVIPFDAQERTDFKTSVELSNTLQTWVFGAFTVGTALPVMSAVGGASLIGPGAFTAPINGELALSGLIKGSVAAGSDLFAQTTLNPEKSVNGWSVTANFVGGFFSLNAFTTAAGASFKSQDEKGNTTWAWDNPTEFVSNTLANGTFGSITGSKYMPWSSSKFILPKDKLSAEVIGIISGYWGNIGATVSANAVTPPPPTTEQNKP